MRFYFVYKSNIPSFLNNILVYYIIMSFSGLKDKANALDGDLNALADPFKSMAKMTVKMCACAGSGDVLTIQELLHICSEHYTPAPVIISCHAFKC